MSTAREKLERFLTLENQSTKLVQLTPDASTREYFRIEWSGESAIACAYSKPFIESELPFIDVTNLFKKGGLPVPEILANSGEFGIVVQEDLGDRTLREVLEASDDSIREQLIDETIELIARIQKLTRTAFDTGSIASKLKFDEEKLLWELNFFKTHYFQSLKKEKLSTDFENKLQAEFIELSRELEDYATVLTHRDFHAANLMIDRGGDLRIIDHQDARIGSVAYDLVSLLLDRVLEEPDEHWLKLKKERFLAERENAGLEKIVFKDFNHEFELMTIQRCLKAIGTFSNQEANLSKTGYSQYIKPMFKIVLNSCERINRFPNLQNSIRIQLN